MKTIEILYTNRLGLVTTVWKSPYCSHEFTEMAYLTTSKL